MLLRLLQGARATPTPTTQSFFSVRCQLALPASRLARPSQCMPPADTPSLLSRLDTSGQSCHQRRAQGLLGAPLTIPPVAPVAPLLRCPSSPCLQLIALLLPSPAAADRQSQYYTRPSAAASSQSDLSARPPPYSSSARARSPPPRNDRDLSSYSSTAYSSRQGPSHDSYRSDAPSSYSGHASASRKRSPDARRSPSPQPYKRAFNPASSYPTSSYQQQQPSSSSSFNSTRPYATATFPPSTMAPQRRGNNGGRSLPRSGGGPAATRSATSLPSIPGPVLSASTIESLYQAPLKPQWRNEPKGPLSNYHLMTGQGQTGLGTNGDKFVFDEVNVDGKRVFRATVPADPGLNIYGVGDDANKREAEKNACLSAILQLSQRGLVRATFHLLLSPCLATLSHWSYCRLKVNPRKERGLTWFIALLSFLFSSKHEAVVQSRTAWLPSSNSSAASPPPLPPRPNPPVPDQPSVKRLTNLPSRFLKARSSTLQGQSSLWTFTARSLALASLRSGTSNFRSAGRLAEEVVEDGG